MKKSAVRVALKLSRLSVPEKINRARFIVDSIASTPNFFQNPDPSLFNVAGAINDLEKAWNNAADGGKSKKAMMHEKEDDLLSIMIDLSHYVEKIAAGDTEVIRAAGMEPKKPGSHNGTPDFEVTHAADRGAVRLRCKPKAKTAYRWEFCEHPLEKNTWKLAKVTNVSVTNFGDLTEGMKYWFRVVYVGNGETIPFDPVSIIVI